MGAARTAKTVIDQLISENRKWEWLCYIAASAFLLLGVAIIVQAIFWDQSRILTTAGGVCNVLVWPMIRMARRTMKENQAIRLLEIPLSKAATEKAAADMIHKMFVQVFVNKKG